MPSINLSGEYITQSPHTYLQAAGSDGADRTVKGFHLRWAFKKNLGDNHLPKGDLSGPGGTYPASYGFNKNNDFVKIHRTPFVERYFTELNFNNNPTTIVAGGAVREWRYTGLIPFSLITSSPSKVIVSFPNIAAYDALALTINPATNALNFIKNYTGEIQVRLENKLCFRVEFHLKAVNPGALPTAKLRYESVSLTDTGDLESKLISCRNDVTAPSITVPTILRCEDIERVRFDRVNVYPEKIRLYAFKDFFLGINETNKWTLIDNFALTLHEPTAYKRLENTSAFIINNSWPKFNDVNFVTTQFTVKVANYQHRWSNSEGLAFGVQKYLTLSQTASNYKAIETTPSDPLNGVDDDSNTEISYFDLLSIVSIDFHVARMLGLGHIDANNDVKDNDHFVYLMEYDTVADIGDGGGARPVKHLYMTPHLSILDYRLPEVPRQKDVTYGLEIDNGTATPAQLTDANGYAKYADIRFVNIHRESMDYERAFESFFQTNYIFCICHKTVPVAFGLEYKKSGQAFVKPELNHDFYYNDGSGTPETNIIPNSETNPIYRHQETQEGIHCYALYSVNWFSRASALSPEECTDYTEFPKRNSLIPPANFAVQLVQTEEPPILTTTLEQTSYNALVGDKTLVRASFDWNYIHHKAHQFADKAQLFFNKTEKKIVQGKILAVSNQPGHKVKVTTTPYTILSTDPAETVQPKITPGQEGQFVGSLFSVDGQNYRVASITTTDAVNGNNPTFLLHQIKETNSVENPIGSNFWLTTESYVSPEVGEKFLVAENLGNGANWDNRLQKTIYLERFGLNDVISITGSTNNDGEYHVSQAIFTGGNTEIKVYESINDTVVNGSVMYEMTFPSVGFNVGNTGFLIAGNVTSAFSGVTALKIKGSDKNDGNYTIVSVTYTGSETEVVLSGALMPLETTNWVALISINKTATVTAYNSSTKKITVSGDYTAYIRPTRKETRLNEDGTTSEFTIGGLTATCTITEFPDVYNPDNVPGGSSPGDPVPGSRTGVYTFTFIGNPLPDHIDPQVSWFAGKIRVMEDLAFLPTPLGRANAERRMLDVWNVTVDVGGNLIITANDPTFMVDPSYNPLEEYVPIVIGSSIEINYHPSYLLYLKVDEHVVDSVTNEFNEDSILPDLNEGSRKTFLGIRSVDTNDDDPTLNDCVSHVATPAAIIAEEIRIPLPPLPPSGPLYATRPDFYGKSTYSMDIGFTNVPYSVLVYKANEQIILKTLYSASTLAQIMTDLAAIPEPNAYFTDRWFDFVNVVLEISGPHVGQFKEYPDSTFRFPIPDNTSYVIPQTITSGSPITPFNGTNAPGSSVTFSIPGNPAFPMLEVVKQAIAGSFTSQTEAPMIFQHVKSGLQTSSQPPRLRDDNDVLIAPTSGNPLYNPTPFAVKPLPGILRFTDYHIDGASISSYFYYAVELSDRQKKSAPSGIVGPIQLINTKPAKEPKIKRVLTHLKNESQNVLTSVSFELENYIESERIARIAIYRSINSVDALTIRTMDLAAEIDVDGTISNTDIRDVFDGLDFPLFGEDLHYRLVALRKITLEDGVTVEYIPSEPSALVRTTIVDAVNPPAPFVISENGTTTATELQQVILKWKPVCYNGKYSLQKMNASGNWQEIYSIKSNETVNQYPPLVGGLPDFVNFDVTAILPREDADQKPIYHRFRVQVENSSGLFNRSDSPVTLATGCFDLSAVQESIIFTDSHSFSLNELASQEVDDGTNNNPGSITFNANIVSPLPAGHNSFDHFDIILKDDLGNTCTKTISTPTGSVVFNHGDGDTVSDSLELNSANHLYTITTALFTDLCTTGFKKIATLNYVHGPYNDLTKLNEIIQLTDSSHSIDLSEQSTTINDGVATPISLTFTDISNVAGLTIPQTFDEMVITLFDNIGNSFTKTILATAGSVTFNDGEGGLELNDADVNRYYTVEALLKTVECPTGVSFSYNLHYSYTTSDDFVGVVNVVSLTDANGATNNPLESGEVDNGFDNPGGAITLTDLITANLPAGHTIATIEVDLYDGIGGFKTKTLTSGSSVIFNTGDGDPGSLLDLSATNPNPNISLIVRVTTDICPQGVSFSYYLNYTYSAYEDLGSQTAIVNFQDNYGLTKNPLTSSSFNDGVHTNPGGSMTFTDVISSNLPAGDTFDKIEVTVEDGLGNSFMNEINSVAGNVIISHGNGGLQMNAAQPNRTYTISIKVITTLCPDGVTFVYAGRYTFGT